MLDRLHPALERLLGALCSPLSVAVAWVLFRERRPLCALAHLHDWRRWRRVFGPEHCARSWAHWTE